ncbi:MAG: ISL3 family transposase [Verrucomicrobiota bacterium]
MNIEKTIHGLLGLDECWEVRGVDYDSETEKFFMVITETDKLWEKQVCPHPTCKSSGITCYDHTETRSWRHMDVFGKRSEILCNVPRGKCPSCHRTYRVKVPWEGKGKHFTQAFEGFALALMREMPVSKASGLIGECDQRMWRILFAHVDEAYSKLDMSEVVWIGADELSARKGHDYLTVFADLMEKRVIFATEGKDAETFQRFADALYAHNGHPKAITQVAIDMSPAYQKGVRENLGNAEIVFDKYHAVAMVNDAVDKVRKAEANQGDKDSKKELKASRWIFRKNPSNLTKSQTQQLEELDLKNLVTGIAYQMRLNFQQVYRSRNEVTARKNMVKWIGWVKRRAKNSGDLLEPMIKVANSIERHLEGILAHWKKKLTTAFMEGLNSVFSAVKRKARGFRSSVYMITMLYFVAGKLRIPA